MCLSAISVSSAGSYALPPHFPALLPPMLTADESNKNVSVLINWEDGENGHYKGIFVALEMELFGCFPLFLRTRAQLPASTSSGSQSPAPGNPKPPSGPTPSSFRSYILQLPELPHPHSNLFLESSIFFFYQNCFR